MPSYGQFCPVAKAMEVLDERWTLIVVRELLLGSKHFNDIRRGVPKMSPALLSKRLQTLTRAGLVTRTETAGRTAYTLTECGRELSDVVEALLEEMPEADETLLLRLGFLFAQTRNPRYNRELFRYITSLQEAALRAG